MISFGSISSTHIIYHIIPNRLVKAALAISQIAVFCGRVKVIKWKVLYNTVDQ